MSSGSQPWSRPLVLDVVRLQRWLQEQSPVADGGRSAIGASPEVWAPIE